MMSETFDLERSH